MPKIPEMDSRAILGGACMSWSDLGPGHAKNPRNGFLGDFGRGLHVLV